MNVVRPFKVRYQSTGCTLSFSRTLVAGNIGEGSDMDAIACDFN